MLPLPRWLLQHPADLLLALADAVGQLSAFPSVCYLVWGGNQGWSSDERAGALVAASGSKALATHVLRTAPFTLMFAYRLLSLLSNLQ